MNSLEGRGSEPRSNGCTDVNLAGMAPKRDKYTVEYAYRRAGRFYPADPAPRERSTFLIPRYGICEGETRVSFLLQRAVRGRPAIRILHRADNSVHLEAATHLEARATLEQSRARIFRN